MYLHAFRLLIECTESEDPTKAPVIIVHLIAVMDSMYLGIANFTIGGIMKNPKTIMGTLIASPPTANFWAMGHKVPGSPV
jgi:hypothetical protein